MAERRQPPRPERRRIPWWTLGALGLWLGIIAFCAQFALASAAELESQATVMGWMLVSIVFGAGLSLFGAVHLNRPHDEG
jgi:hypothetical protein